MFECYLLMIGKTWINESIAADGGKADTLNLPLESDFLQVFFDLSLRLLRLQILETTVSESQQQLPSLTNLRVLTNWRLSVKSSTSLMTPISTKWVNSLKKMANVEVYEIPSRLQKSFNTSQLIESFIPPGSHSSFGND